MENAVDALKIGFAVLVFTMALSLTISMFTQARETADVVLHSSDITEYMEYESFDTLEDAKDKRNRVVGLETIIPTLYKYYKENYTVIFRKSSESSGGFMELYTTKNPTDEYKNKYNTGSVICSFDVNEELERNEPWTGTQDDYKKNLDAFLSGGTFEAPSGDSSMNYKYSGFIKNYGNRTFIENLGEYEYDTNDSLSSYGEELVTTKNKKRVIIYTLQ